MRGIWIEDGRLAFRDDLPCPEPPPGEVEVRVLLAGICRTDLELRRGYAGFRGVPGHEFVGHAGPEAAAFAGRRVVGEINAVCAGCEECRAGRPRHCSERTVLGIVGRDGAFAERLVLPAANLHPVPGGLDDEEAVFVEPLAAALEVLDPVARSGGDRVLVVGDGKLGLLVAQVLAHAGCSPLVAGRHAGKLAILAARGIRTTLDGAALAPRSFDAAVECTGNASGFAVARRAVRPRGTIVLKSTYAGALEVDASALVVDEIALVGSRCGAFAPAIDLLARGAVDVRSLVSARYALADGVAAFEHAGRPGTLKVLLRCAGS